MALSARKSCTASIGLRNGTPKVLPVRPFKFPLSTFP